MSDPLVTTTTARPARLAGQRVVVTGGARGIGGEIARRFASEGAGVVILDRLVEDGAALAKDIGGGFLPVDLVDPVQTASVTSDAIAQLGGVGEGHYAASKAAVVALTRVAALEWGTHGITVNALCPGYVLTDMGAATRTDDNIATWRSYSPLGRLGEAADVAGVALFLASPDADYLTGQAINVTGGMVMR